jgi:hypothetical protein
MFSLLKPVKSRVLGTEYEDWYVQYSEPIGLRYWCPGGVKAFFGVDIPIGEQIRVWISGGILNKETNE